MFFDLITKRRSVRQFEKRPLETEKIEALKEAALRAPSSRSLNPWEFVFVTHNETLGQLARAKPHGAGFMAQAALGVVVCADPEQCDVWIEDASIATIYLHLAATELGLGSCWIQIRKRMHAAEKSAQSVIRDLLEIPPHLQVLAMMAIGYPAETKAAHPSESLQFAKIHMEHFG